MKRKDPVSQYNEKLSQNNDLVSQNNDRLLISHKTSHYFDILSQYHE